MTRISTLQHRNHLSGCKQPAKFARWFFVKGIVADFDKAALGKDKGCETPARNNLSGKSGQQGFMSDKDD